jgi:phosphatidate cytidylyltransferase
MALNKQVFKTRALTALVFVAVMLVGLLYNSYSFMALFTVINIGAWVEYFKLIEKINANSINKYAQWLIIFLSVLVCFTIGYPLTFFSKIILIAGINISTQLLLLLAIAISLLLFLWQKNVCNNYLKKMCLAGFFYITMPIAMLFNLWHTPIFLPSGIFSNLLYANIFPLAILCSIWVNDTMAYIVGSFIGKTPFSKISPKKTWEGTIGGAILCVIMVGFLFPILMQKQLSNTNLPPVTWFCIAAICAVFGTAGDLLESKIKRLANVKDSGSFMPGHGGFLDRFDSLLIATPLVWLYIQLFV